MGRRKRYDVFVLAFQELRIELTCEEAPAGHGSTRRQTPRHDVTVEPRPALFTGGVTATASRNCCTTHFDVAPTRPGQGRAQRDRLLRNTVDFCLTFQHTRDKILKS